MLYGGLGWNPFFNPWASFLFGAPIGVVAGAYPRAIAPGFIPFPPGW